MWPGVAVVMVLLGALAPTARGADWRADMIIEAEHAHTVPDDRSQKSELVLTPELAWRGDSGTRLTAIGRLRADGYDRLEPGRPEQQAISDASRRHFHDDQVESELRELYLDLQAGGGWLRLGKQQVVWGQADGLKVLDVVNPQRFREFILDEFEDSRIPLWTVNWEIPAGPGTFQLLWIPDRTYNELPREHDLYAFSSPLLVPTPPDNTPVEVQRAERPDRAVRDSDAGLRWSAFLGGWDLTLNYLYHYHDNPVPFASLENGTVVVRPEYQRTHLIGGTFTNAFGDYTVRGELARSTDRWFPAAPGESASVLHSPELSSVLGLDWQGLTDTLVSAQVFQSAVELPSRRLVRDSVQTDLTLLIRRNFLHETLTAEVIGIHNINLDDGLVRPRLSRELRSNLVVSLGADIFYGDERGRYGQFDDLDRIVFGIEVGL